MKKVIVIAEAGVNHNGDIELAKQLINEAARAGADYVKFQTFKASNVVTDKAEKAGYQQKNLQSEDTSQFAMLKKLELSHEDHLVLLAYSEQKGVQFLSTPFDMDSIDMLKEMGMKLGKIPSGEITNLPYLEKMARSFEKIILSTGMADIEEVKEAMEVLLRSGKQIEDITVLHCTSEYPSPIEDVNLAAMVEMGKQLNVAIGYSDHTMGIEIPIAATALGATIIEKHFTLDRKMEGPDHVASLEPKELCDMVTGIRNIELAIGTGIKKPTATELKNKLVARRSIVAARPIAKGEILGEYNLTIKRPGNGISPMKWYEVLGTTAKKDFDTDALIEM